MIANQNIVEELNELLRTIINSLIDGEEGFTVLGHDLKDEDLKAFFLEEADTRSNFRRALEEMLHQIGMTDVAESGTVAGAIHRTWGDIKAKLGSSDGEIVETACQGEEAALHTYQLALQKENLLPVRQTLAKQQAHIKEVSEQLEAILPKRQ